MGARNKPGFSTVFLLFTHSLETQWQNRQKLLPYIANKGIIKVFLLKGTSMVAITLGESWPADTNLAKCKPVISVLYTESIQTIFWVDLLGDSIGRHSSVKVAHFASLLASSIHNVRTLISRFQYINIESKYIIRYSTSTLYKLNPFYMTFSGSLGPVSYYLRFL